MVVKTDREKSVREESPTGNSEVASINVFDSGLYYRCLPYKDFLRYELPPSELIADLGSHTPFVLENAH